MIESEKLTQVINTSLNGIYIHDVKLGQNIFINSRCTELTGYTSDDLNTINKAQFLELFHPDDRQRVAEHMEKLVSGSGDVLEIEYRFKTKDGRWIWCLSRDCVFARDENGTISQFVGTFLDITDRKQLEENARQLTDTVIRERDQLEALINSISDEIWFANSEGKFTLVNPSAALEFAVDETDGIDVKKLAERLEVFRPNGSLRPAEESPALRALQGEEVRNLEEIIRTPATGELRHRQVNSTPVRDKTGSIIGSVSVVRDITELKRVEQALREREERLNLAINNAGMGTWDVDLSTGKAIWSETHFRMLGYEPQNEGEATMEMWRSRLHPDDLERVLSALDRAKRQKGLFAAEHRILRADTGEVAWLWPFGRFLYNEDGEPFRFTGVFFDSTERKETEGKLRQTKATSEALNRINEMLHSTLDFDEIMRRIVAEGSAFLGSESAAVCLRVDDGWIVSQVHGMSSSIIGTRMKDDQERHAVFALKSRELVSVEDGFNDDRFNKEHMRRHNIRSVLVAPLIVRNAELGVILFNYHTARHVFTEEELNFTSQMASIAGIALANARLLEAHKAAEDEVRKINRELEQLVKDRTAEIEAQYKELQKLNTIVKQLAQKTIEAMESDRKVLSKEIHDSIAGTLAAIKLQLEARISRMDPSAQDLPSDLMPIEKIVEHLQETIKETKKISWQLRTPTLDDFGLQPALIEHIQHFKQFYPGIKVASQIEIKSREILTDIQTVLYRVVQEALNNVGKHSGATRVRIKLTDHQNQLRLEVEDNGCGFDHRQTLSNSVSLVGYGVHSMRERVEICKGEFQIRSEPGRGTIVDVSIPI
jgi:PAS domain S-box-containing protein